MLGATRDYAIRPGAMAPEKRVRRASADVRHLASFIPVYPKEIGQAELARKAGVTERRLRCLIPAVSNSYLLCEDDGRYSLLRRGRRVD